MSLSIREEPDALDVTLGVVRRSPSFAFLWLVVTIAGVMASLFGSLDSRIGALCAVALLFSPLGLAPMREGLRLSDEEVAHYLVLYGRTVWSRRTVLGDRKFYVPERPTFLSWKSSTPVLALTGTRWVVGAGCMSRVEAEDLASRMNQFRGGPA